MKPPRGLSVDEAVLWAKVAATVKPLHPVRGADRTQAKAGAEIASPADSPETPHQPAPAVRRPPAPAAARAEKRAIQPVAGLDSHWERRLRAGSLAPDMTLDLHEHSLDAAYQRLLGGLDLARETGARVVLVIAGRARPAPAADRSGHRGAIRAKLLDWLAASRHAGAIAAIRAAHRRHGGDGALYVILRKPR